MGYVSLYFSVSCEPRKPNADCVVSKDQNVGAARSVWRGSSLVGCLMWPWGAFGQLLMILGCSAFWQILSCRPACTSRFNRNKGGCPFSATRLGFTQQLPLLWLPPLSSDNAATRHKLDMCSGMYSELAMCSHRDKPPTHQSMPRALSDPPPARVPKRLECARLVRMLCLYLLQLVPGVSR